MSGSWRVTVWGKGSGEESVGKAWEVGENLASVKGSKCWSGEREGLEVRRGQRAGSGR